MQSGVMLKSWNSGII